MWCLRVLWSRAWAVQMCQKQRIRCGWHAAEEVRRQECANRSVVGGLAYGLCHGWRDEGDEDEDHPVHGVPVR